MTKHCRTPSQSIPFGAVTSQDASTNDGGWKACDSMQPRRFIEFMHDPRPAFEMLANGAVLDVISLYI